ncbi:vWA domain-containing protein [Deinococcus sp. VB343]|uniref:vWA domain-containing protein n=1 Tax=Deinococcus sp. VB343 TaxID=3385567 RepID=UPI0039C9EF8B
MSKSWWQTPQIRKWALAMWRYYSWRPGYRLTLSTELTQTAYVNMQGKLVVCNPEYPYPPLNYRQGVRNLPGDIHEFQMKYLESLIAHEAGHTHFSGPLPAGLLGQLVNIIEDERMERLMVKMFQPLGELFRFAGDADAAYTLSKVGTGGDVIQGCLMHRFTWHHPKWKYVPDQSDACHWPKVREILEAAWVAPEYEDVICAAREIFKILGLPENAPRRKELEVFTEGENQELSGAGTPEGGAEQGGDEGGGVPERPTPEKSPTSSALLLREQTLGLSRHVAGLLRRKGSPAQTVPSRDRGRFRYDRYESGSERYFDQRIGEKKPGETSLYIAVDISASMDGERMKAARELTFMLVHAAQLAEVPATAIAFDDYVEVISDSRHTGMTALNNAAELDARGGTVLAPALKKLWATSVPGQRLSFIISDGGLRPDDAQACRALCQEQSGLVVPVLLSTSERVRQQYEENFGRAIVLEPQQMQTHILGFLRAFLK